MNQRIIAIDFDGTCVTHDYPDMGKDIGAQVVLKQLTNVGHRLILLTMRSGIELRAAVEWFKQNDIPLWGINENPEQKSWTNSPKVYAHLYIDDAALGCPVINGANARPYADWGVIQAMLFNKNLLFERD